jgi:DNA-binding response OmpR family regulator
MVYQIVLQDAGYGCIPYTDSVKAMQEFRPNYYHLILLDIKIPVLNGLSPIDLNHLKAGSAYLESGKLKS